ILRLKDGVLRNLRRLVNWVDVCRPPFVNLLTAAPREAKELADGDVIGAAAVAPGRLSERFGVLQSSSENTVNGAIRVAGVRRVVLMAKSAIVLGADHGEPHKPIADNLLHHLVVVPRADVDSSATPVALPDHFVLRLIVERAAPLEDALPLLFCVHRVPNDLGERKRLDARKHLLCGHMERGGLLAHACLSPFRDAFFSSSIRRLTFSSSSWMICR